MTCYLIKAASTRPAIFLLTSPRLQLHHDYFHPSTRKVKSLPLCVVFTSCTLFETSPRAFERGMKLWEICGSHSYHSGFRVALSYALILNSHLVEKSSSKSLRPRAGPCLVLYTWKPVVVCRTGGESCFLRKLEAQLQGGVS